MRVFGEKQKENRIFVLSKKLSNLVNLIQEESEILSQKKNKSKYDSLLLNYDRSFSTKELIEYFNTIEKFIKLKLPIILKKQKHNYSDDFKNKLTESEQFELSKSLMKKLGFNFSKGRIDKSIHPFCGGSTDDVRITTRFDENDSFSCFDALMHETGHALYEQGLPKKWIHQPLGSSAGMSLHESQSLFIEKQIIKSLPTSKFIESLLVNILKKATEWKFIQIFKNRNRVKKAL